MGMENSKKGKKVIQRALSLYNKRINGRRLYTVAVVREILRDEFGVSVNRSTIYHWLKIYNKLNGEEN